jgi:hypothetical protein
LFLVPSRQQQQQQQQPRYRDVAYSFDCGGLVRLGQEPWYNGRVHGFFGRYPPDHVSTELEEEEPHRGTCQSSSSIILLEVSNAHSENAATDLSLDHDENDPETTAIRTIELLEPLHLELGVGGKGGHVID